MASEEKPRDGGQVNIRLEPAEADVLAAISFLDGIPQAEVLRPQVVAYLKRRGREEAVQEALQARVSHRSYK